MKMSKLEKRFVNARKHAVGAIKFAEEMLEHIELKEKVDYLEVGCGIGESAKHLYDKYDFNVTGIDVDPEQIEHAKKTAEINRNIVFRVEDSANLSFKDNSFDIVLIYNVLHHVASWRIALEEVYRVLRTGGFFILGDIVFANLLVKISGPFKKKFGVMTFQEMREFILNLGFEEIHLVKSSKHSSICGVFKKG